MEKVPRQSSPTTLIIEDEVQRVPERQNFFMRSKSGDLGEKVEREFERFIAKAPRGSACFELLEHFAALGKGDVASKTAPETSDPRTNADSVKALGNFIGADMTAACKVPEYVWYSHDMGGDPIEARHPNAIVFVLDQGRETMEGASGDDWISGAQSIRAYLRAAMIGDVIAAQLRRLG